MTALTHVEALTECGLRGDRYVEPKNRRSPAYQVTLIEIENIDEFSRVTGFVLVPDAPRRNLVTQGVRLNDLCGKCFLVGETVLEGLELCEPCGLFAKRTHPQVLKLFKGKGGLKARILVGGTIGIGDEVKESA